MATSASRTPRQRSVTVGLDSLLARPELPRGQSICLVCNQASVTSTLAPCIDAILGAKRHDLKFVLAPEHGVSGYVQAQEQVDHRRDGRIDVEIHSLYGSRISPDPKLLAKTDALVFDVQDVGSRYYTYVWTMLHCMYACAEANVSMAVLDRPNPINGATLEGNVLDPRFASFVGMHPIPVRHGMTVAELANLFNDQLQIGCDLLVFKMQGWRRATFFDETGLFWVPPSPNMPTLDTALVYPGMCLLEGTNISEGRGTTKPFELFGAPFIDAHTLCERLNHLSLPGARFRPASFRPTFDKYAEELCHGAQIHVLDRKTFKPYLTGLSIVSVLRELVPDSFKWRKPPYEFETERLPFDILTGTDSIRLAIEAGVPPQDIEAGWRAQLDDFRELRKQYLLY